VADIVLRGSFDTSQQRRYVHVPFEVPPSTADHRLRNAADAAVAFSFQLSALSCLKFVDTASQYEQMPRGETGG
jgi:hypothetical protein